MTLSTTTHLNLPGTAREALAFYQSVLGGDVRIATYGDFGMPADAPGADEVVFGRLSSATGVTLMAYDIPGRTTSAQPTVGGTRRENGITFTDREFFQSLQGDSYDEVVELWEALAVGAEVVEPLAASAWSPGFGMLTDRFGVTWVIDVRPTQTS
jgi:PhnB protein